MISTCVRVPRRAVPRRAQVFLATDDSGVAAEARAVFPAAGMAVRTLQSDRHIPPGQMPAYPLGPATV
jgi:hypothetical protein